KLAGRERADAWKAGGKEIVSPLSGHEPRNAGAQERFAGRPLIALDDHPADAVLVTPKRLTSLDHLAVADGVSRDGIGVVALSEIVAVIDPLLLHKLELLTNAGVEGKKHDTPSLTTVVCSVVAGQVLAVGDSPPNQPAPANDVAAETQRRSWIGAAHMRTKGTAGSFRVICIIEIVALIPRFPRRIQIQRGAIRP